MSFLLLWIEFLLASTLFVAAMIAGDARTRSRLARLANYGVSLLFPGFFICGAIITFSSLHFNFGFSGTNFWFSIILLVLYVAFFFIILFRATRPDASGLPRALSWPKGRLHI